MTIKYTCPMCGGAISAIHRRALDTLVVIHNKSCPGYTKKDEKT
jgi:hypothetical protein